MENSRSGTVLIIDDEDNLARSLATYLSLDGFDCTVSATAEDGLLKLSTDFFDAAVLDLRLPGMNGLELLARLREEGLRIPVIMISAHGDVRDAVEAMKTGAADYLVKPFDPAELSLRLSRAISVSRLFRLAEAGKASADARPSLGTDPAMREIVSVIRRVAPTQSTVLITGESGTGKEIVAREIHALSPRSEGPFVPVNLGAIPESLLESELFGHEKGSFTGADSRRTGLFELAGGGTLFLDELAEMPLNMQVKLLRVIQDRTITRLGGMRQVPVDVRIIAATNRDLEESVASRTFREDLYFRLNVIRLRLPPLRERRSDISRLAGYFLQKYSRETGRPVRSFAAEALDRLDAYDFPGNIRELENIVERAVILCEGETITAADLSLDERIGGARHDVGETGGAGTLRDAERIAIESALVRNAWHREKTAVDLGISRRTLLNKIREFALVPPGEAKGHT